MMIDNEELISYRVDARIDGRWISNHMRFPYADEAHMYAFNQLARYNEVKSTRIVASTDNITDRWVHGRREPVKPGDVA